MNEIDICNLVVKMLSEELDNFDINKFGIEERTDSYVSLIYCANDFFRVKYTDNAKWISIRLAKEDMNVDDERFSAQKKKTQFHWKAKIDSYYDIYDFKDELVRACKNYSNMNDEYIPRTNVPNYKVEI